MPLMSFFTDIGPQLGEKIPHCKIPGGTKHYLSPRILNSFLLSPTTPQEIHDIIKELDENKSSGPCSVPTKLLKLVSN